MAIKIYPKDSGEKLSATFKVRDFACHGNGCCDTVRIDERLVEYLQRIREHFGKPLYITSAYRCASHNKNVGGATGSLHARGQAADIVVRGVAPAEVAKYAESIGILGIGLYETAKDGYFVHIDTRSTKSFWYGQGQEYRSTFGGRTDSDAADKPIPEVCDKGKAGKWRVNSSIGLKLRSGPSTEYPILETMANGSEVMCCGCHTGEWLFIVAESGKAGFCHGSYLTGVEV